MHFVHRLADAFTTMESSGSRKNNFGKKKKGVSKECAQFQPSKHELHKENNWLASKNNDLNCKSADDVTPPVVKKHQSGLNRSKNLSILANITVDNHKTSADRPFSENNLVLLLNAYDFDKSNQFYSSIAVQTYRDRHMELELRRIYLHNLQALEEFELRSMIRADVSSAY